VPGPRRKSPRLRAYDYASLGVYFVTACARDRECLFGDVVKNEVQLSEVGRIVEKSWSEIPAHSAGVTTDAFVVMPNHIHGIVWLARAGHAPPLPAVIGSFKAAASRTAGRPLWQRSFHDRVIRDESELRAFRQYVADNPLKWAIDRENPVRR
jgi:REP element-mobilizing transposase RayT